MFHALAELSAGAWAGLAVLAGLAMWIFGLITNAVLKDRGFGIILNGTFMFLGFVTGAGLRLAIFGTL